MKANCKNVCSSECTIENGDILCRRLTVMEVIMEMGAVVPTTPYTTIIIYISQIYIIIGYGGL